MRAERKGRRFYWAVGDVLGRKQSLPIRGQFGVDVEIGVETLMWDEPTPWTDRKPIQWGTRYRNGISAAAIAWRWGVIVVWRGKPIRSPEFDGGAVKKLLFG